MLPELERVKKSTRVRLFTSECENSYPIHQLFVALCYRTVVSLSCLCVTLVHCGATVGCISMPLCTEVGISPGHILLDGDPVTPKKGAQKPPTSQPTYCDQATGWVKLLLGTEVGLGPGHIVLNGDPAPPTERGTYSSPLHFGPLRSGTITHLSNC